MRLTREARRVSGERRDRIAVGQRAVRAPGGLMKDEIVPARHSRYRLRAPLERPALTTSDQW
jgi:hypothetical protein